MRRSGAGSTRATENSPRSLRAGRTISSTRPIDEAHSGESQAKKLMGQILSQVPVNDRRRRLRRQRSTEHAPTTMGVMIGSALSAAVAGIVLHLPLPTPPKSETETGGFRGNETFGDS